MSEKRRYVFTASAVADERIVVKGLPEATTDVRSSEACVVVDSTGRIRSFRTTVEHVIGGERATHHLEYDLTRVGNVTVEEPEWVDETTTRKTSARAEISSQWIDRAGAGTGVAAGEGSESGGDLKPNSDEDGGAARAARTVTVVGCN